VGHRLRGGDKIATSNSIDKEYLRIFYFFFFVGRNSFVTFLILTVNLPKKMFTLNESVPVSASNLGVTITNFHLVG
jgi:hypothetical protein